MLKEYVIITAGGKGKRMGSDIPKQFMELKGLPVILHTIKAFTDYSKAIHIVLVLPGDGLSQWEQILEKYPIAHKYEVCTGGETRFDSIRNGLELIDGDGLVAIHDAVRPLLSVSLISMCFELAAKNGNAVPVVPLSDSIREVSGDESFPVDRDKFRLVQTPQVFDVNQVRQAYEQAYRPSFSDDATVVESFGIRIHVVEGEKRNIKITNVDDLIIAEAFMKEF